MRDRLGHLRQCGLICRLRVRGASVEEAGLNAGSRARVDRRLDGPLAREPRADKSARGFGGVTSPLVSGWLHILDESGCGQPGDGRFQGGAARWRRRQD